MRRMNVIRSRGYELFTERVNKVALSACDDKRIVCENGIYTLAYGHWRITDSQQKQLENRQFDRKQFDQQTCMHVICKQKLSVWKRNRGEMLGDKLMNCGFHH